MPSVTPYRHDDPTYPHSDRWRARLWLGVDPITGRQRRRSVTFSAKNRRAAEREAHRLEAEALASTNGGEPAAMTFADLVEIWWQTNPKNNQQSTRITYRHQLDRHILPTLGHLRLDQLSRRLLHGWLRDVPPGIAPVTRNRHFAIVKAVCKWGYELEYLPDNPTVIGRLTVEAASLQAPASRDVANVIRWLDEHHPEIAVACWVFVATSIRRSELAALRWADVDLDRGLVRIEHGLNPDLTLKPTKTRHARTLIIDPETVAQFARLREAQTAEVSAIEGVDVAHDERWFCWGHRTDGPTRPIDPQILTRAVAEASEAVGGGRVWIHGLRHFAATAMFAAGLDPVTAANRLGHANPLLTASTYASATTDGDRRASLTLAAALAQLTSRPAEP